MKKKGILLFKVYTFTWFVIFIWFLVRGFSDKLTIKESFSQLVRLFAYKQFIIAVHIFFVILYLLFLLIRYFVRVYRKRGVKTMLKHLILRFVSPVLILVLSFNFIIDYNSQDDYNYLWNPSFENQNNLTTNSFEDDGKHRGMSVFGWRRGTESAINELLKNNIEWVAVIPFFDQKDEKTFRISTTKTIGEWTRRDSTFLKTINALHEKNIKVMLKPHLWLSSGWRSDLDFASKSEWQIWFDSYRTIMLHYATMASELDVKLLCIGTELKTSIKEQPEQWQLLIKEIKQIYSGKLTYAANWHDEYEFVEFWDEMDYIGIQGYFPLTDKKSPELSEIKEGWLKHKATLKAFSELHDKPILFTEIGYKSDVSTTIRPWEWNSLGNILTNQKSTEAQQLAFEAMFESLWNEPWFSGCYIWQWNTGTTKERAAESFDFSPRFKPAQNTIAKWYGNHQD